MARYCFYCGRELAEGERCSCRTARNSGFGPDAADNEPNRRAGTGSRTGQAADAPRSSSSSSSAASSAAADNKRKQGRKRRSWRSRFAAWRAERVNARQAERSRRRAEREERKRQREARQGGAASFNGRSVFTFIHQLFTRPTAIISGSRHAGMTRMVVAYLLEALVFSLIVLTFVRFSNLTRIALLRDLTLNNDRLWESAGLAMLRGFAAALLLSFLRVLIARLVFRFIGRQRVPMDDLYRTFLPGTYYEILFMLISLLFVSGTGLQSLVMLLCAFAVRTMIDTYSLKDTVQLSTDRLLFQSAVIHFILFVALAFLLNFVVPSLSRMNLEPQQKNQFKPNLEYSEVYKL